MRERGKQVKLELPVCSYLLAVATSVCMIHTDVATANKYVCQ